MCGALAGDRGLRSERRGEFAREPVDDYSKDLPPPRIALSSAWIDRNAEPEVAAAVLAAARLFRNRVEVAPPDFDTLSAHCLVVMQSEASAQHIGWIASARATTDRRCARG